MTLILPPVIPTDYSSHRADLYEAVGILIDAFISSEDYECGRVFLSSVPDSLTGEGPVICIGDVAEEVQPTIGLRITTFRLTLWYLDWVTDHEEYAARVNRWADRMRDLLRLNARIVTTGVLSQASMDPGEMQQGQIVAGAPSIGLRFEVQDGGFGS